MQIFQACNMYPFLFNGVPDIVLIYSPVADEFFQNWDAAGLQSTAAYQLRKTFGTILSYQSGPDRNLHFACEVP